MLIVASVCVKYDAGCAKLCSLQGAHHGCAHGLWQSPAWRTSTSRNPNRVCTADWARLQDKMTAYRGYQHGVVEAADEADRAQRLVTDHTLELCHGKLHWSLQVLVLLLY